MPSSEKVVKSATSSECPVDKSSSGCPVDHGDEKDARKVNSPLLPKQHRGEYNKATGDWLFGQSPHPEQKVKLSTVRTISSIEKSERSPAPEHQPSGTNNWVYPSSQQYYNAMKKKGYNPDEKDVDVILAIHNAVNEQGWTKILEWERLKGCEKPKLKEFRGRPNDLTPRARFLHLIGYSLPFDRHDWVVDSDGTDARYVIDFYSGHMSPQERAPISMHLDVRPALDSLSPLLLRLRVGLFGMRSPPAAVSWMLQPFARLWKGGSAPLPATSPTPKVDAAVTKGKEDGGNNA